MEIQKQEIEETRKIVAEIVFSFLAKNISAREVLEQFPQDVFDPSLQVVWHAIIHYESDEDIRLTDKDYALEQDNYLEMIAYTLKNGKALPQNIIKSYNDYYKGAQIKRTKGIINWFKRLIRFTI